MTRANDPGVAIRPFNVLFLCTGNTARSILAEAAMNAMAHGRFRAYSAGSHPKGRINPVVAAFLREKHLPVDDARSKSWDEFAGKEAPKMDLVITVCDSAAGEACPIWPGRPATAHWGVADPGAASDEAELRTLVENAYAVLRKRISMLVELPVEQLDRAALQVKAREIGKQT